MGTKSMPPNMMKEEYNMIFIETARLILRNVAAKDADNMYDYTIVEHIKLK